MITPEPPAVWWSPTWHAVIEQLPDGQYEVLGEPAVPLAELPADAVRLVPDEMDLLDANEKLGEALTEIGMALGLPRPTAQYHWGRTEILAKIAERDAAVPDTGQAPDVPRNEQELIAWQHQEADRLRALLGTDTTPDRLAWIDTAAETAAVARQARYQETACARRPAAASGDTVQPDLAYARSEVDKWLADGDPYCILPTRTEHIPALLARLDELEGTR